MEIILMRHGKPSFTGARKVATHEMASWIQQYDLSCIGCDQPPEASRVQAHRALMVFSSPLPRAISSARNLNLESEIIDKVFREAELPVYLVPVIKLSPYSWAIFFRLMWLCGMSQKAESLALAKRRARQATNMLVEHARDNTGPVLLIGHGIMNRLIAKELISLGWEKRTSTGKGYWETGVYKLL
ncbi:histidine phosphatase family protein [Pectobacterium polaris]|uniref:histidine phosphatase family protein n=1 Tax=Pectobacterium polaris TaxID=2042057 RepID=UPI0021760B8D|nr:histidine phosphatase family protein [Pectobacterium polaris]MDE8755997.1 histidine phosphatase family protein [Pectobacterium polaris]